MTFIHKHTHTHFFDIDHFVRNMITSDTPDNSIPCALLSLICMLSFDKSKRSLRKKIAMQFSSNLHLGESVKLHWKVIKLNCIMNKKNFIEQIYTHLTFSM